MEFDREELAWAAGFFDGEGSTVLDRGRYVRVSVVQVGVGLLERFQAAVGGVGKVYALTAPSRQKFPHWKPQHRWQTNRAEDAQAVLAMLWFWLGSPKREQASNALRAARQAATPRASEKRSGAWHARAA